MRYLFKFSLSSVDKTINVIAVDNKNSQHDYTEPLGRWPEGEKQFRHVYARASLCWLLTTPLLGRGTQLVLCVYEKISNIILSYFEYIWLFTVFIVFLLP